MYTHSAFKPQPSRQAPAVRCEQRGSAAPAKSRGLLARLFKRAEVTTFHRCLAVHIHFMAPRSALD